MITDNFHVFYRRKIYPYIKDFRGSYFLLSKLQSLSERFLETVEGDEVQSVFDKDDWDNLIIIDGCRYDVFVECFSELNVEKRVSVGSCSSEFIEKTFRSDDYSDINYVTANPHFSESKFKSLTGFCAEDLFNSVFHTYLTDWDDENGTVHPENVVRDAFSCFKLFDDKKLVVHFMQPHHPFIGSDFCVGEGFSRFNDRGQYESSGFCNPWLLAELGVVDRDSVVSAYKDNLFFVMDFVFELVESLDGRTVVTSDHGNFMGEAGLFGHPEGFSARDVREVPWVVFE